LGLKTRLYLLIFLVMIVSTSGTLVLDEDFEDYSTHDFMWHATDDADTHQWMCQDLDNDTCVYREGLGCFGQDYPYSQIIVDGATASRVLEIQKGCQIDHNDYTAISIKRNYTFPAGAAGVGQRNFSLKFDWRYVDNTWDAGATDASKRAWAQYIQPTHLTYDGFQDVTAIVMGGRNTTTNEEYLRLRPYYDTVNEEAADVYSSCDINDGGWHTVAWHLISNGTQYYDTDIYVDGVLCMDYNETISAGMGDGGGTSVIYITSKGEFNTYIDNIELYIDELVSPLTDEQAAAASVFPCPVSNCLFYDDFSTYGDYGNLSEHDWGYFGTSPPWITIDDKLYINTSNVYKTVYQDINDLDNDEVTAVLEILTNESITTPAGLNISDGGYVGYRFGGYCDDSDGYDIFSYDVYMFQDIDFSEDENSTIYNIYISTDASNKKLIGTIQLKNGVRFAAKVVYDMIDQEARVSFIDTTSDTLNEYSAISKL